MGDTNDVLTALKCDGITKKLTLILIPLERLTPCQKPLQCKQEHINQGNYMYLQVH